MRRIELSRKGRTGRIVRIGRIVRMGRMGRKARIDRCSAPRLMGLGGACPSLETSKPDRV
jgi:hypothetical protein